MIGLSPVPCIEIKTYTEGKATLTQRHLLNPFPESFQGSTLDRMEDIKS